MAVRIGFNSAITFGQSGSFYSSEIIINLSPGPFYLSQNTATLLPLPAWVYLITPAGQSVDVQYSPDSQVTWFGMKQGTSTLAFCDTAGSIRLFGNHDAGTVNVRAYAAKQA